MSLSRPEGAAGICRGLKELQAQRPTDSCKEKGIVSIGSRSARQVPRTPDKLPKRPTRLHAVRTQRRRSRRILIAPGRFAQTLLYCTLATSSPISRSIIHQKLFTFAHSAQ